MIKANPENLENIKNFYPLKKPLTDYNNVNFLRKLVFFVQAFI